MNPHPHHMQLAAAAPGMPHPQAVMQPQMLYPPGQAQLAGPMPPMHYQQIQKHQLAMFWQQQIQEMEQVSAEAPVLFAKACEMFILELTLRSWIHTEENKRRTLQRNDIAGAVSRGDIFDFLVDIVPRDDLKDEDVPWAGVGDAGDPSGSFAPMYYPGPMQHHGMPPQDMMVVQPNMNPPSQMMYPPPPPQ